MGRQLSGVVFSDLGQGASFMALGWVQESLRKSLGFAPYPGTLNVRLETKDAKAAWRAVRERIEGIEVAPRDPSFCRARCFLVKIEGRHRGAVVLPEVANYPEDKIEVIARVRLKDALGIKDGERVTIEFVD